MTYTTYQLSDTQEAVLAAAAARLNVTHELALEMAVSRLALDVGLMPEGDLCRVDMSQSLEDEPGSEALFACIPGFEDQ